MGGHNLGLVWPWYIIAGRRYEIPAHLQGTLEETGIFKSISWKEVVVAVQTNRELR